MIAVAGNLVYQAAPTESCPGAAPPPPSLLIGREGDLRELKARLAGAQARDHTQVLTTVQGWPGVGKTTLAAALANDAELAAAFPDGVLWVSLGTAPNVLGELAAWGRALGVDLGRAESTAQASAALASLLRDQRRLLMVDDAWQAEHARPFCVGGRACATLITTRHDDVARKLAPNASAVYRLPVLTEAQSLDLLAELAPDVAAQHADKCRELARRLDGLPLAL